MLGNERLSDEQAITRYANAVALVPVRRWASPAAPRVARLRYRTEDGPLETYLALESHVDATTQRAWIRIRIPARPNGRTGWVRRDDLGPLVAVTTMLRVDGAGCEPRCTSGAGRSGRRALAWASAPPRRRPGTSGFARG
jgi:hypothetical protein